MPPRKKGTSAASPPPALDLTAMQQPPVGGSSPLTSIPSTSSSRIPSSIAAMATRSVQPSTSAFRAILNKELAAVAEKLRQRRAAGAGPLSEAEAQELVEGVMEVAGRPKEGEELQQYKQDARKLSIERALEEMLFDVALYPVDESSAQSDTYDLLCDLLDIILAFSERGYADESLPLNALSNLMEVHTLSACERIFSWIEYRVERLTKGMQSMRGKGPILLRLSNELLRRLPRSKQEHVVFSGRILMFLSSVFPMGEKSGVNLRGNFNVGKMTTFEERSASAEGDDTKMDVDEVKGKPDEELYSTFWSLQRVFTNPPSLFTTISPSTSSTPASADPFTALQTALKKTLAAFAAATKKEKDLSGGNDSHSSGKQKARAANDDEGMEHYFFPKFLTSKNLLELELADPTFRRQILVQMLILYQFLLSFAPTEHARLLKRTTNHSALLNFVLSPENEKWIRDLKEKTLNEMDSMEGGRRFRQSIELILKREQNWIDWKLRSCIPFELPPLPESQSDVARNKLKALSRKPKAYMHALGNPNLSRSWQHNTTTLEGFTPSAEGNDDFDKLTRDYQMTTKLVKMKQIGLKQAEEAKATGKAVEIRNELEHLDIKLSALHWRAIRAARSTYLHLFSDIKAGDLDLLLNKIEEERRKREEAEEKAERLARGEPEPEPEPAEANGDGAPPEGRPEADGAAVALGDGVQPELEDKAEVERKLKAEEQAVAKVKLPEVPAEQDKKESSPLRRAPPTPKRPRSKDEEDVAMADTESPESKKRRTEGTETLGP